MKDIFLDSGYGEKVQAQQMANSGAGNNYIQFGRRSGWWLNMRRGLVQKGKIQGRNCSCFKMQGRLRRDLLKTKVRKIKMDKYKGESKVLT